jgi:hypothetical protein
MRSAASGKVQPYEYPLIVCVPMFVMTSKNNSATCVYLASRQIAAPQGDSSGLFGTEEAAGFQQIGQLTRLGIGWGRRCLHVHCSVYRN